MKLRGITLPAFNTRREAVVGWVCKDPLVFFDSNDTSEPTDWIYEAIGAEYDTPQPAKQTITKRPTF
jgi:hypothetical protein